MVSLFQQNEGDKLHHGHKTHSINKLYFNEKTWAKK